MVRMLRGHRSSHAEHCTNQKIKLIADRESYQPGDEASVFIPNPFPDGAQALITLERDRVVSYQTLEISGSGESITLPLEESDAPNIYLSVILIGQEPEGIGTSARAI